MTLPPGLPIREVVVAGGGIVGWSAAAALKRHLPSLSVTVVPTPPPEDALADRIGITLPSIVAFHEDLGLRETDTVARAGSGYRIGTIFEGWAGEMPAYVHSYGSHGAPFGATSFHHFWIRAARQGRSAPFDAYSPAAAIGRAGRFVHPQGEPDSPLGAFSYGLNINPPRYLQMMRAFARHLGVVERVGSIREVRLRSSDGFIESLRIDDGSDLQGDLFVDCTGPAAVLRSTLDGSFEDWSAWLACDRILFGEGPPTSEIPVLDRVTATATGWRWEAAGPARRSCGLVYSSAHLSDDEAKLTLCDAPGIHAADSAAALRAGRWREPWLRNCVAIGDAALAVEPLEWTNLHLAHSAIDRIVSMVPGRDCAPIELAEYNRQTAAEAGRVRDFLILHYVTANRPEPFWRNASAVVPPGSLAHTLRLYRERGRLPFYEEETFVRDSWLAVLIGQGVLPARLDALTDLVPVASAEAAMARMRSAYASLPDSLPSHSTYLRTFAARAQR